MLSLSKFSCSSNKLEYVHYCWETKGGVLILSKENVKVKKRGDYFRSINSR